MHKSKTGKLLFLKGKKAKNVEKVKVNLPAASSAED
jgi:hypothetical protein